MSTVAAGDVREYVGATDVVMFHSVADVQGLNSITEQVLANAAHALAGMIAQLPSRAAYEAKRKTSRPALGITMFGVTTPCVQAVTQRLEPDYDCLVFHATGVGGRAMEALGDSGLLAGFLDLTTTEVADMVVGGILASDQDRIWRRHPHRASLCRVGRCVGYGQFRTARDGAGAVCEPPVCCFTIPTSRSCAPRVTRNRTIGEWIGQRLN